MATFDVKKVFEDEKGNIVVVQKPNAPLIVAAVFYVLRSVPIDIFEGISFWGTMIALLFWAYLEIFYGVNTFRRILGAFVTFMLFYSIVA